MGGYWGRRCLFFKDRKHDPKDTFRCSMKTIEMQGMQARKSGLSITDNPYRHKTDNLSKLRSKAWSDGWSQKKGGV